MSFAYLHESFPDPTKTFVYREVAAMAQLGMAPTIFSIRRPSAEEVARMEAIQFETRYFPEETELRAVIEDERGEFSIRQRRALSHWRAQKGDSTRVFEALWLGRELRRLGIRHVHAHFAGLAARTAWLVRELWGIGYSFTGHADDIFTPEQKPIGLEMLVRDARFIATETDYSRARIEKEHPAARGKTRRIFNGIDIATLASPFTGIVVPDPSAPPRIVSVGRLVEKKGFPSLLRACAELRERGVPFVCDIVGAGPLEEALRQAVAELGLEHQVILHGAQPQRFVQRVLRNARVFALAAQMEGDGGSDNLPTVIMEAMAAGVPVVSTRIAGIPEMIDDGKTGKLVAPGDPAALADALMIYLRDPALAQAHGAAARSAAIEKFDVRHSARQLAELLTRDAGVPAPREAIDQHPDLRGRQSWWQRLLGRRA
jgi:colanic acid/amylovoran biosynthesis glycosyltransferase